MKKKWILSMMTAIAVMMIFVTCKKGNELINKSNKGSINLGSTGLVSSHSLYDKTSNSLLVSVYGIGIQQQPAVFKISLDNYLFTGHGILDDCWMSSMNGGNDGVVFSDGTMAARWMNMCSDDYWHLLKLDQNGDTIKDMILYSDDNGLNKDMLCRLENDNFVMLWSEYDTNMVQTALNYSIYDKNLNKLSNFKDTMLSEFQDEGGSMIADLRPTSDGGYIAFFTLGYTHASRHGLMMEKRDANFNLVWRKKYTDNANNLRIFKGAISNDRIVVYANGSNYFPSNAINNRKSILIEFDANGNYLNRIPLTGDGGEVISAPVYGEDLLPTADGGFLATMIMNSTDPVSVAHLFLYKLDKNLNIVSMQQFGKDRDISYTGLADLGNDKFAFLVPEAYKVNGNETGLTVRIIDGNANIINR